MKFDVNKERSYESVPCFEVSDWFDFFSPGTGKSFLEVLDTKQSGVYLNLKDFENLMKRPDFLDLKMFSSMGYNFESFSLNMKKWINQDELFNKLSLMRSETIVRASTYAQGLDAAQESYFMMYQEILSLSRAIQKFSSDLGVVSLSNPEILSRLLIAILICDSGNDSSIEVLISSIQNLGMDKVRELALAGIPPEMLIISATHAIDGYLIHNIISGSSLD